MTAVSEVVWPLENLSTQESVLVPDGVPTPADR